MLIWTFAACGTTNKDMFIGSCQTSDDCSDFNLLAPYTDSENQEATAFLQSTCSSRSGTLSAQICASKAAVGSCTFFHAQFGEATLEQIAVFPSTSDANSMSQECSQEGGVWSTSVTLMPR